MQWVLVAEIIKFIVKASFLGQIYFLQYYAMVIHNSLFYHAVYTNHCLAPNLRETDLQRCSAKVIISSAWLRI